MRKFMAAVMLVGLICSPTLFLTKFERFRKPTVLTLVRASDHILAFRCLSSRYLSLRETLFYVKGCMDAAVDVANDSLVIKRAGLPVPWETAYEEALREHAHIYVDYYAGCIIMPDDDAYARGYNALSVYAIGLTYGEDYLDLEFEDAMRKYHLYRPGTEAINSREVIRQIRDPDDYDFGGTSDVVFIQFEINGYGIPTNLSVLRGLDEDFDTEAMRVVRLLRFEPAGDPTNATPVKMTWPDHFERE